MDWREHYEANMVTPDEAIALVRPGDNLAISVDPKPTTLMDALTSQHERLADLRIFDVAPIYDPGWLRPDFEGSFRYSPSMFLGPLARSAYHERRIDFAPVIFTTDLQPYRDPGRGPRLDATLVSVSPPDDHGYCSFGKGLWNKRSFARYARVVLAQVDDSLIRTYGDNYIHVSEIDRFVEHSQPELSLEVAEEMVANVEDPLIRAELERVLPLLNGSNRYEFLPNLLGGSLRQVQEFSRLWATAEPSEVDRKISQNVAELVRDGDTIQIGVGSPSSYLPRLGTFDDKRDLGWHSEMTAPGILSLIRDGVITGERKNVNTGVAVFTAITGCAPDEIPYAHNNPRIELRDAEYVVNIGTISAHHNYVSMNNALSIDFSGQINAETIGDRQWNGTGGQPELHMGAVASKGGRGITLLRSTAAAGGTVSRIVPQHPPGSAVTIPRTFADTIVTEYGVAQLLGKTIRERAQELIAVAHPDFRAHLKREFERLYYP